MNKLKYYLLFIPLSPIYALEWFVFLGCPCHCPESWLTKTIIWHEDVIYFEKYPEERES